MSLQFSHGDGKFVSDNSESGSYRITTWWRSMEDFTAWTKSDKFTLAHAQKTPEGMFTKPGKIEIHSVFLSTDLDLDKGQSLSAAARSRL